MKKIFTILAFSFLIASTMANPLWSINDGIKQYKIGNFNNAKNYFLDYLNNNPNDENGYFWLAKTYQKIEDETLKANDNFKKAYELYIKKKDIEKNIIQEQNPDYNFEDYFDIAVMYFENGKFEEAMKYADMMLEVNKKSPSAYFIKAKVLSYENNLEKAKENLEKAIVYNNGILSTNLAKSLEITEIPKMEKEFYYNFAYEKFFEGEISEAIKYCEKYFEKDDEDIEMMNFLTELYLKNDDKQKAQAQIEKISEINPNNIQNLLNKANFLSGAERGDILNCAYKINPNNEEVLLALANYYIDIEDYKNSKKYFENLISINDELFEAYFGYVYSLIQLNDLDKALINIRKMSEINSNSGDIQYLLAQICILKGEYNQAIEYLYDAIRKDDNQNYYIDLAYVNNILKKYSQSNVNLDDALNLGLGANNKINEYYIRNYVQLNDLKNAKSYFDGIVGLDKNSIIYKYNLYIIYKLQGDKEKENYYFSQLKKIKPQSQEDFIILSDFYFENGDIKQANKILENASKKYSNSFKIESQKSRLKFLNLEES